MYQTSRYLDILFYTQQFPDTMSGKGVAEPWMANQYRLRTSPTTLTKYLDTRMSDTSSLQEYFFTPTHKLFTPLTK